MNVKKSLENRVRGWLPKTPSIGNTSGQVIAKEAVSSETKMETVKLRTGFRTSTRIASYSVLWTFIGYMYIVGPGGFYFRSSWSFRMTWVVVGVAVGVALNSILTQRQLNILAKRREYEGSTTLRLTALAGGIAVLAVLALIALTSINVPTAVASALFSAVFASIPAQMFTRTVFTRVWETRHRIKIYEDKNGLYTRVNRD